MQPMTVVIDPRRTETRILLMEGRDERLRAVMGPALSTHPRAAATFLEALGLWQQRPVSCVLCVDAEEASSALHLTDALGMGERSVHFEVSVEFRDRRVRHGSARRISSFGDFRDLRQLCLEGMLR